MGMTPGLSGSKTELFDGVKVDTINEYTTTKGVAIQGKTDGTAVATGYVGESYTDVYSNIHGSTSNTWFTQITRTLPAGKWKISTQCAILAGGITGINVAIVSDVSIPCGGLNYNTKYDGFNSTGTNNDAVLKSLPDMYIDVPVGGSLIATQANSIYSSNAAYRLTTRYTRVA